MIKSILIAIVAILTVSSIAYARWAIQEVKPDNVGKQPYFFKVSVIHANQQFDISVRLSGTEKYDLPDDYSAQLTVRGKPRAVEHSEPIKKAGRTTIEYKFSLQSSDIQDAVFEIAFPYKGQYAKLGGSFYKLNLKDFVKE